MKKTTFLTEAGMITIPALKEAEQRMRTLLPPTMLHESHRLSTKYGANIYLKREDQQVIRSYKLRGAFNKMSTLSEVEKQKGIVCASAGNHSQGVAFCCHKMGIHGVVFMPITTPQLKIDKVKFFGKDDVEIRLVGDNFDAAYMAAKQYAEQNDSCFIHPFDDHEVIAGQGTIGLEILAQAEQPIDYLIVAIGGGGLCAGLSSVFSQLSPHTKIIGVEPEGAPSMKAALEAGKPVELDDIDPFVDGAAVRCIGTHTFHIASQVLDRCILIPEGLVCSALLQLYNQDAIVVEPAGALTIASLDMLADDIKGKNVVCIVSGGNNDIVRTEEIKERALLYQGLKHYFLIQFPQRAGALRDFLNKVLGPEDDIVHFQYTKKTSRESGPALVGIELKHKADYQGLLDRMKKEDIHYRTLNDDKLLFDLLV